MSIDPNEPVDVYRIDFEGSPAAITPNEIAHAVYDRDFEEGDFVFVTTAPSDNNAEGAEFVDAFQAASVAVVAVANAIVDNAESFATQATQFSCSEADAIVDAYRSISRDDLADTFLDAHVLGDEDGDDEAHLARKATLEGP